MGMNEQEIFDKLHVGVVTAIQFILDDSGNPTDVFSGFVSVKLLHSSFGINWVRWCNPLISQKGGYGVITVPVVGDTLLIEYDETGRAYARGMLLYSQAVKPTFSSIDYGSVNTTLDKESNDNRLRIKPGELLLRGKNGSSVLFRNDGTTIFKLDDTKVDGETLVIKADSDKGVSILNAGKVTVTAESLDATCSGDVSVKCKDANIECDENAELKCKDAKIEATSVEVVSDQISLGKTGASAPIIRNTDHVQHIDPILGLAVVSVQYLSSSLSTGAK